MGGPRADSPGGPGPEGGSGGDRHTRSHRLRQALPRQRGEPGAGRGALSGAHGQGKVAAWKPPSPPTWPPCFEGPVGVLGLRPLGGPDARAGSEGLRLRGALRGRVRRRTAPSGAWWWPEPGRPRASATTTRRTGRGRLSTATGPTTAFPAHVRSLDVGFARASGALVSAGDATEFFQLVEKAEGELYWLDLDRLLTAPLRPLDTARARELGCFLAPRARDQARRAHALRAAYPRAGRARRVHDGDSRQLSASLSSAPAARLRGARARRGLLALAVARAQPPTGPGTRRFPSLEPPLRQRDRLLGARPKPGRVGRAGRRRERARHQLPVLRPAQGGGERRVGRGGAVRLPVPHLPRRLSRGDPTTRSSGTSSRRSSRSARWSSVTRAGIPTSTPGRGPRCSASPAPSWRAARWCPAGCWNSSSATHELGDLDHRASG